LPGGLIGINETAERAAIREIKEELGVRSSYSREYWNSFKTNFGPTKN